MPHFCVDYQTFDRRMKTYRCPLPRMEEVFDDLEGNEVFSNPMTFEEHVARLIEVFRVIAENGLKLKTAKCSFAQSQTRLLGHIVTFQGINVDPETVSCQPRGAGPNQ